MSQGSEGGSREVALAQEKMAQAQRLLKEESLDLWLTLVRESGSNPDPLLPLIYPADLTWLSALLIGREGARIAIVGHFDGDMARSTGLFDEVIPYHHALRPPLLEVLERLAPHQIGLNYSVGDVLADGLSHGLYLHLQQMLEGTRFADRLCSSEPVAARLRARKSPGERRRIEQAVATTARIYGRVADQIEPGIQEQEIAALFRREMVTHGVTPAWDPGACPTVTAGPESPVGHNRPGRTPLRRGQLLHLDFGIRQEGYCSDIQRVIYLRQEDETEPPAPVRHAFQTVRRAVEAAREALRPGVTGQAVDQVAREIVTGAGYPEYMYATGHQMGRTVHDGGTLLGPTWERYGSAPHGKVQEGEVYTIEPGVMVPGFGYLGLEEDVIVGPHEADYLGPPQQTLWLRG